MFSPPPRTASEDADGCEKQGYAAATYSSNGEATNVCGYNIQSWPHPAAGRTLPS